MKPICVPCERFMRMKKSGFYFIEGMPTHEHDKNAGKHSKGWTPYKIWAGDLWHCPDCGAQVVSGVGSRPLSEHYLDGFAALSTQLNAMQLFVKDC